MIEEGIVFRSKTHATAGRLFSIDERTSKDLVDGERGRVDIIYFSLGRISIVSEILLS